MKKKVSKFFIIIIFLAGLSLLLVKKEYAEKICFRISLIERSESEHEQKVIYQ